MLLLRQQLTAMDNRRLCTPTPSCQLGIPCALTCARAGRHSKLPGKTCGQLALPQHFSLSQTPHGRSGIFSRRRFFEVLIQAPWSDTRKLCRPLLTGQKYGKHRLDLLSPLGLSSSRIDRSASPLINRRRKRRKSQSADLHRRTATRSLPRLNPLVIVDLYLRGVTLCHIPSTSILPCSGSQHGSYCRPTHATAISAMQKKTIAVITRRCMAFLLAVMYERWPKTSGRRAIQIGFFQVLIPPPVLENGKLFRML